MLSPVFKKQQNWLCFYVGQCPTPRALLPYTKKKFIVFSPSQKKKKNPSKYDFMKMNITHSFPLSFSTINKAKYYTYDPKPISIIMGRLNLS